MADSIRSFGYGYFKAKWSNQQMCEIHDVALSYLPPSTPKKAVASIKEIIQGKIPSLSIEYETKEQQILIEQKIGIFSIPVSPCLLQRIINKLRRVVHEYYSDESLYDEDFEKLMLSENFIDVKCP